ncbi:MAG TPA: hypothetical protein DF715_00595, partial [Oceanicaulis sp.]|nr:hypothetical protein [Oceanicaulis sp.]
MAIAFQCQTLGEKLERANANRECLSGIFFCAALTGRRQNRASQGQNHNPQPRSAPVRLAVIPARAGSKRIPGKNIAPFHGRPMLGWAVVA